MVVPHPLVEEEAAVRFRSSQTYPASRGRRWHGQTPVLSFRPVVSWDVLASLTGDCFAMLRAAGDIPDHRDGGTYSDHTLHVLRNDDIRNAQVDNLENTVGPSVGICIRPHHRTFHLAGNREVLA